MPTVPTLGPTPNVAPSELQAPQVGRLQMLALASGGSEVENLGAGLMRSASQIGAIADQQQATQNEIDAKNADNQYLQAQTQLLHDPANGYLNTQGQNATGDAQSKVSDAIRNLPAQIADNIQNPRARQMFLMTAQARATAALQAIDIHASQQGNQAAIEASSARGDAAAQAMPNAYDPLGVNNELYNQYQSTLVQELNEQADRKGLPPEARAQFVQAGLGKAYAGTLSHLMTIGQTGAAKAYLNQVRDQMPQAVADKATELLQAGTDKDTGLAASISAQQANPGNINAQEADLKQRFSDGKISAAQYDIALSHAHADYQLQKSQEADSDRAFLGNIWAQHVNSPGFSLANLTPQQLQYAKNRGLGPQIESILSHNESTDNPALFLKIMDQSFSDPAGFKNGGIAQYQGQLSKSNFAALEQRYISIDKGDVQAQQVQRVQDQAVKATTALLSSAGLDAKKNPDAFASFEAELHQTLYAENAARLARKQAPLTAEEARGKLQELVKEQSLAGTGLWGAFQTSGPTYKLPGKIPDQERAEIVQRLSAGGIPATAANIVDYYNRKHAKQ